MDSVPSRSREDVEQKLFMYRLGDSKVYSVDWVVIEFVPVPEDVFVVG